MRIPQPHLQMPYIEPENMITKPMVTTHIAWIHIFQFAESISAYELQFVFKFFLFLLYIIFIWELTKDSKFMVEDLSNQKQLIPTVPFSIVSQTVQRA